MSKEQTIVEVIQKIDETLLKITKQKAFFQGRIDAAREAGRKEDRAHWQQKLDLYTMGVVDGYAHGAMIACETFLS